MKINTLGKKPDKNTQRKTIRWELRNCKQMHSWKP